MEELCKHHFNEFKKMNCDQICGYIKSEEDFKSFLLDLMAKGYSYSIRSSGSGPAESKSFTFDSGLPCTNIRRMYFQCCHGDLYYETNKSSKQDHLYTKKRRVHIQGSKKIGCQSRLIVKIRHVYPAFRVDPKSLTRSQKRKISTELRMKISEKMDITKETWHFIQIAIKHNHDISGKQMWIHEELKSRIEELVKSGITSIPEIKLHLREKVSEMFKNKPAPEVSNRAFFPNHSVIYSHVHKTLLSLKQPLDLDFVSNKQEISDTKQELDLVSSEVELSEQELHFVASDKELLETQQDLHFVSNEVELSNTHKELQIVSTEQELSNTQQDLHFVSNELELYDTQQELQLVSSEQDQELMDKQQELHLVSSNQELSDTQRKLYFVSSEQKLSDAQREFHLVSNEQELSSPHTKCTNRLVALRQLLQNMIDTTYNLEDGGYLEPILNKVLSIKKELVVYKKREKKLVLLVCVNGKKKGKRKIDQPLSDTNLVCLKHKKIKHFN